MHQRNLLIIAIVVPGCLLAFAAQDQTGQGKRFAEVVQQINKRHFQPVDSEQLFNAAMDGVFRTLDDRSKFIESTNLKDYNKELKKEFAGIGVELDANPETGKISVVAPVFGGPAWRAGIRSGDLIDSVNGIDASSLALSEIVAQFRGEVGSAVNLRVRKARASDTDSLVFQDITIRRQNIAIESIRGDRRLPSGAWDWWLEGAPNIAYLRISYFSKQTGSQCSDILHDLADENKDLEGLVIDLRGNAGGVLESGVSVCDLFLEDELVVAITNARTGGHSDRKPIQQEWRATPGKMLEGVPIAILIDEFTANVSEVVAACLQDHSRATIVGSRSFGNASIQTTTALSSGAGAIRLTTNQYQRPSGSQLNRLITSQDTDEWGVRPNSGFAFSPTRQQLENWISWRRERDLVRVRRANEIVDPGTLLPQHADPVLGRSLTLFHSKEHRQEARGNIQQLP
jgi:carboxyl-terminal processing protease